MSQNTLRTGEDAGGEPTGNRMVSAGDSPGDAWDAVDAAIASYGDQTKVRVYRITEGGADICAEFGADFGPELLVKRCGGGKYRIRIYAAGRGQVCQRDVRIDGPPKVEIEGKTTTTAAFPMPSGDGIFAMLGTMMSLMAEQQAKSAENQLRMMESIVKSKSAHTPIQEMKAIIELAQSMRGENNDDPVMSAIASVIAEKMSEPKKALPATLPPAPLPARDPFAPWVAMLLRSTVPDPMLYADMLREAIGGTAVEDILGKFGNEQIIAFLTQRYPDLSAKTETLWEIAEELRESIKSDSVTDEDDDGNGDAASNDSDADSTRRDSEPNTDNRADSAR